MRYQQDENNESDNHMAFVAVSGPDVETTLSSADANEWQEAITNEYNQLVKRGVFEEVDHLPPGKKAVGSKVVLKEKLDENGKHAKYKARIVAQGFSQVPGIDYSKTFSSVAKFMTLQVFLTLAATLDLEIHQIDVVGAYLEGNLDEEIYMKAPSVVKGASY